MSSLSQLSERVGGGKAKFAIIVAITCLAAAVASQWSAARYKLAVRGPDNSTTVVDFSRLRSASAIDLRTLLDEPVEAGAAAKQLIVFVSGVECGGCLTEAGSWEHAAEVSDPAKLQVTIVVVRATEEEARSFARLFSGRVRILFDKSRRLERIISRLETPFKIVVSSGGRILDGEGPDSLSASQKRFEQRVLR